ncbi:serine/threonine-protein kinase BLUS1-like [Sesamum indicum]|uniref:Serine/threonine-protein kinase BLUS1-like n=1 Tax=Sesamum indicum TaxID=4182 RepID=A0A6I9UJS5_SESIN|nr:serine/threonine-protein kinase BLUS1-like [Sesamum indicum]
MAANNPDQTPQEALPEEAQMAANNPPQESLPEEAQMATNPQTPQEPLPGEAQMATNNPQTSQEPLPGQEVSGDPNMEPAVSSTEAAQMATNNPQTSQEPLPGQEVSGNPNTESAGSSTEAAVTEQDDTSNSNPMMILLDPSGVHGKEQFRIMDPIGTACNGSLQVYKAAYIADRCETYATLNLRDVFVTVKYVSVYPETEVSMNLRARIEKNGLIPDHPNILGTRNAFFYGGNMCVVFPFMELGSMQSIVTNTFPDGMLEGCALVVLRETLRGLFFIHSKGHVHKEISCGHIFLNAKPEIKLAFSASVFELYEDQDQSSSSSSSSSFLPAASICEWAAAPEIQESVNSEYTQKADIWSIGITALELAYGGLTVMNREVLENIVAKINLKKKLPKKIKKEGDRMRDKMACLVPTGGHFKKNRFSKEFENLVVKCLDLDPTKRPTADELLQDAIFTNLNLNVRFFAALVRD